MTYKYQSNVDKVVERIKECAPELHERLLQLVDDVINVAGFPQEGLLFVHEEEPANEEAGTEKRLSLFLTYQGIDIVPGESYQDFLSRVNVVVQLQLPEGEQDE